MILQAIYSAIIIVFDYVFSFMPDATRLPTFLGVDIDTTISSGFGYVRTIAETYPPLTWIVYATGIYLGWKLLLLIIKAILGSRAPHVAHE